MLRSSRNFRNKSENVCSWCMTRIISSLVILSWPSPKLLPAEELNRVPDFLTVKSRSDPPTRAIWKAMKIKTEGILAKDKLLTVKISMLRFNFWPDGVLARHSIPHFNKSRHPASAWVIQQLREAFPFDSAPGYLIFDRGANFNQEVI